VLGQRRDVLLSVAERWQPHREDREAVVEVLAEAALARSRGEILVGGGEDPDVD
jgi:hypothetical protein